MTLSDIFNLLFSPLFQPSLATFFAVLILGTFISGVVSSGVAYKRGKEVTAKLHKIVKGVSRTQLVVQRELFREQAEAAGVLHFWNEFDESLVSHNGELLNTIDAGHFFNSHSLGARLLDNRLLAALPGLLTALGVLGTFVGLTLGLTGLAGTMDIENPNVALLQKGIGSLINGAALAFITSVWGVFFSFAFNLWEKIIERNLRNRISALQDTIDYLFPRLTAEKTLHDIHDESKASTIALEGLAERISNELQSTVQQVGDSISAALVQALNDVLAPALNKLATDTQNSSSKAMDGLVERFIGEVGKVGEQQAAIVKQASEDMSANLGAFNQQIGSSIREVVGGIQEETLRYQQSSNEQSSLQKEGLLGLRTLIDQQAGNQSESSDALTMQSAKLATAIEMVAELNDALAGKLKDITDKQLIIHQKLENTSISLESASDDIKAGGQEFNLSANMLAQELNRTVDQTKQSQQILTDYQQASERLLTAMANQADRTEQASNSLAESADLSVKSVQAANATLVDLEGLLKRRVDDLTVSLQSLLDEFTKKSTEQMSNRLESWNENTASYINKMAAVIEMITEVVDEIDGKVGKST
jgi:hypothetical protein